MTELEQLIKQRDEISAKIRDLRYQMIGVNGARLEKNANASYGLVWRVCVLNDEKKGMQWRTVVNGRTREDVIAKLGNVIDDLKNLYVKVQEESKDD